MTAFLPRTLLLVLPSLAACGAGEGPESFAGTFVGEKNGAVSRIELRRDGDALEGRVRVAGQEVALTGAVDGDEARGQLTAMGRTNPFRAVATPAGFDMTLTGQDAFGRPLQETIAFRRAAAPATEERVASGDERDPVLVGAWTRSQSFGGGYDDFTGAMEEHLVVRGDGTLTFGTGRFYAGGSAGSIGSDGGSSEEARWRTAGNVVEVGDGRGPWRPLARYYVEGAKMLLTFADGSRQVWHRAG